MSDTAEPEETLELQRRVAYRCACGRDVLIPTGGEGSCEECGRNITLRELDPSQTLSFCAEVDSSPTLQLGGGPDRAGESLGHFRLMSQLGHGGMGAVYRALDESLQRFVAVKVIRSAEEGGSTSAKQVNRLLDEAVTQARLNHPNVVTIYYVGRDGEEPFFAMELLPGPTLAQQIQDGPLPFEQVARYAQQVCAALAQATKMGLVHGDIKPSNLILSNENSVKLGDFGLAQTEQSGPSDGISGTLSYMAPEISKGEAPSAQSDMYSLGVTLFELTFGRRPYAILGTTLREQLDSHRIAAVEFPEKWPTTVPESWKDVLTKLLARDPANRFEKYEDLRRAIAANAPVGVTPAGLLNRGLAMMVDYILIGMFMIPLMIPAQLASQVAATANMPDSLRVFTESFGLLSLLTPLVPGAFAWAEWRGWRSPGRYLFQLRVVDSHGLMLSRKKRVIRNFIRNAPVWIGAFSVAAYAVGFSLVALAISPVDELIVLINTLPVFGRKRMAIHDRVVGSRVVLETSHTSHHVSS